MIDMTITMPPGVDLVGIRTFDEPYGKERQFLMNRRMIEELLHDPAGSFQYAEDSGNFVEITRLAGCLHFSFAWLNRCGDGYERFTRQSVRVPSLKIRYALKWGTTVSHLYIPKAPQNVRENVGHRQTLCKAIKDFFR